MPNTLLTSDFLFKAAENFAMILSSNMVASQLVSRTIENQVNGVPTVGKSGGTVSVKVLGADVANEQNHRQGTSALTTTDVTETSVKVDALDYFYVRKKLDTLEGTWSLDNFTQTYVIPAAVGIAEKVDQFMIRKIAGGFAPYIAGTAGTAPSTAAHIIAGRKVLQDNRVPQQPRVGLIGTAAEASFLALPQFVNSDYGEDNSTNLRAAALSQKYGINWFVDQNVGTHANGDVAGTVLSVGAGVVGAKTSSMDAFTAATGKIHEGTRFTVAGDATVYHVTRDAFIASNAASGVEIAPAIVTGWADNAEVTFLTAYTQDVLFHPGMVAGAIVAPTPLMNNSQVASFNGISVRLSVESTISDATSGAADFILMDVYCGGKVIRSEGGVILQGG